MSRSLNEVKLLGNLGSDPDTKFRPSGGAVTVISLATSKTWKDNEGNQQERTEWHRVVFFNRLAEIAGEYLKKGSKCYLCGELRTNKWQDKDGLDRYTTEIIANDLILLNSRGGLLTTPDSPPPQIPQGDDVPFFDDDIPF